MAADTPGSEHRNALDSPAVTVVTPDGDRVPLTAGLVLAGDPPEVADSEAAQVSEIVDDFNALLAALRARGVLAEEE